MRRVFALLTMVMVVVFAACEQEPNVTLQKTLKLSADKSEIVANGTESVTFTVKDANDAEVTGATIYFAETNEAIEGNTFKTSVAGSYAFYAVKGNNKSNELTITAKAATNDEGDNKEDNNDDTGNEGGDDNTDDGTDDGGADDGTDDGGSDDGKTDNPSDVIEMMFPGNTQVWYNTPDMSKHDFSVGQPFDANIVSNEFGACANGQCYSFFGIEFDAEVTEVKQAAFSKSNLEIVYLPHSIKTIGQAAFLGSSALKTVHIGSGIKDIVMGAFTNCGNLSELYIRAVTPPSLGEYALVRNSADGSSYVYLGTMIYVPAEAVSAYKSHADWSKYADYIVGYDFVAGKEATGGDGEGSSTTSPFAHRLLIVEHTGVNCSYCPSAADRLYALANSEFASYYSEVTVHGGDMAPAGEDPAYSAAAATLHKFYKVTGVPTIYLNFNGGTIPRGDSDDYFVNTTMSSIFNANRKKTGADVGIAIDVKAQGSTLSIDIDVKSAKDQEYFVAAWVLENNIYSPNQNGATSWIHKTYNHALRYIANNYSTSYMAGDSLGVIAVDDVKEKSYSVPIQNGWVTNNLEVVVIVSASKGGSYEVVNTAVCPVNSIKDYEYR